MRLGMAQGRWTDHRAGLRCQGRPQRGGLERLRGQGAQDRRVGQVVTYRPGRATFYSWLLSRRRVEPAPCLAVLDLAHGGRADLEAVCDRLLRKNAPERDDASDLRFGKYSV